MIYLSSQSGSDWDYFEVHPEDLACYRQISFNGGKIFVSNIKYNPEHFYLAEGEFGIGKYQNISREEFEQKWAFENAALFEKWPEIKAANPECSIVELKFECYYPQGILFTDLKQTVYLGNKNDFEFFSSGFKMANEFECQVQAEIVGYDDANCWILVEPIRMNF